jgi:hypothetical protein
VQTVERIERLPQEPGASDDPRSPANLARTQVARLLALHGADRWRYVYEYFLNLWTPDQRYL